MAEREERRVREAEALREAVAAYCAGEPGQKQIADAVSLFCAGEPGRNLMVEPYGNYFQEERGALMPLLEDRMRWLEAFIERVNMASELAGRSLRLRRWLTDWRGLQARPQWPDRHRRISHKSVYRALGEPDIRHRRKAGADVLYRRLVSLDYVIQNMWHQWLPTEAEKLAAFVGALKVEPTRLPQRIYGGALGGRRAYFPIKMPIALLPDIPAYEFVYIDQGDDTGSAVRSWGRDHADLWRALRRQGFRVQVAAVSPEPRSEERTRRIIQGWALPENGVKRPVRIDAFQVWQSPRISGWEAV